MTVAPAARRVPRVRPSGPASFGSCPNSPAKIRMKRWPPSEVGPYINGQPPAMQAMPCSRQSSWASAETLPPPNERCIQTRVMPSCAHSRATDGATPGVVAMTTASTPPGIAVRLR